MCDEHPEVSTRISIQKYYLWIELESHLPNYEQLYQVPSQSIIPRPAAPPVNFLEMLVLGFHPTATESNIGGVK